jgi:hypothetical protein
MARPAIHPGENPRRGACRDRGHAERACTAVARAGKPHHADRAWQAGITGDTALRVGPWFGTSAQFWLNR